MVGYSGMRERFRSNFRKLFTDDKIEHWNRIFLTPRFVVIKDWSVSSQYSHLEGGMKYDDGKLTVPTPGRYYIYAQLYFFSSGRVYIRVNNKDITMIQAPVNNLDFNGTLYAGGVFNLAAGDFITLVPKSYNGAELYMDTIHSYFGAYLI